MNKTVLVTGAKGFIGKNLILPLRRRGDVRILEFDVDNTESDLAAMADEAELVFHLAGINRPKDPLEFTTGNVELTKVLCEYLAGKKKKTPIALSSTIQAELDNPYGKSKKEAEEVVFDYGSATGAKTYVFRLPNVFGKWCQPNYNSAVATFCHNIARDLPIRIDDPNKRLRLVYVDDVVRAFLGIIEGKEPERDGKYSLVPVVYEANLGEIVEALRSFKESRNTHVLPNMADPFSRALYATYLSYLPEDNLVYSLKKNEDQRGMLAEVLKSEASGQLFFSTTNPGYVRGNHYHDSKVEKFVVVHGKACIRLQHLITAEIIEIVVDGSNLKVVDIPPGYTHNIENIGDDELVTLFWANEMFDPEVPDAYYLEVGSVKNKG